MPDPRLIRFARQLRKQSTDAERRIWSLVRSGRLGGHSFRRQHPIEPYIADFYCHAAKLVVELDGGQHTTPDAVAYDAVRTDFFRGQGIEVVRFSDHDALKHSDAVAQTILREVERLIGKKNQSTSTGPPPLPSPASTRERE